ncbi:MAG: ABC transporter ATP-binding protein [Candidatus Marinimicrobia bacterium]|nr:ABC transporter ATP-binding protein [Candidatus Neomarinimicrobiota bacterium]MCF7828961.1 ABC transporter ATP-binding protein [Candidatus Neomarinimicrobiota bacterium]MCF7879921.1 ABC transporter ATP-binding protein [Candidatus Neomarinimicrobiota bacterium]
MIEVQNVSKRYGQTLAVDDVSFRVNKGEIVGFLGPNAAGKTTTMRIITSFMPATSGKVTVAGYDVFEDAMEVKTRIGYLPENPPLYVDMKVEDYLGFVAAINGADKSDIPRQIDRVMDLTSLGTYRTSLIRKLSKGFRQRVGLAQALIHDPEVLVLDEPTVGLDPKQIIEVRELIKELANDHTIILSTHILPEVSMTSERVVIINKGKIVAEDTPGNLMSSLKSGETLQVQVDGPFDDIQPSLEQIDGVTSVTLDSGVQTEGNICALRIDSEPGHDVRRSVADTIVKQSWGLLELKQISLTLEDIFLELTTEEDVQEEVQA